jgi:hypothetical protein
VAPLSEANNWCPQVENVPEKSNAYTPVVILNKGWRIIECRDGIQWILQKRKGQYEGRPRWAGESYCRSKSALLRCVRDKAGEVWADAYTQIDDLPAWLS